MFASNVTSSLRGDVLLYTCPRTELSKKVNETTLAMTDVW